LSECDDSLRDGVKNPSMRDKPDGFEDFDDGGDGKEVVSDDLLDVLVAGVGQARIGVVHR